MPPQQKTEPIVADLPEIEVSDVHAAAKTKATELLGGLGAATRKETATHIAQHIKSHGVHTLDEFAVIPALEASLKAAGKPGANAREGACECIAALCAELGPAAAPYVIPLFPTVIDLMGDKIRPVQLAAQATGDAMLAIVAPNAVGMVMPHLLAKNTRWQSNLFRMQVCCLAFCHCIAWCRVCVLRRICVRCTAVAMCTVAQLISSPILEPPYIR